MIAHLHGILQRKNTEDIIIDVHGIGFLLSIPLSTFYKLPEPGKELKLYTYTHIREDCWQLYGFWTMEEKKTFELLLKVSKIGPKLARNVLSHISPQEFKAAVSLSDISRLNSIPGIGEKTARRLILEIKDKISALDQNESSATEMANLAASLQKGSSLQEDAVSAMVSLGYSRLLAERTINQILHKQPLQESTRLSIEELIKKALYLMAK